MDGARPIRSMDGRRRHFTFKRRPPPGCREIAPGMMDALAAFSGAMTQGWPKFADTLTLPQFCDEPSQLPGCEGQHGKRAEDRGADKDHETGVE